MYCLGHMVEAAVAYYYATGKDTFLNVAIGYSNCAYENLGTEEGKIPGYPGHEVAEMALIALYEITKDEPETVDGPVRPAYEFYSKEKLRSMGVMPAAKEDDEFSAAEEGSVAQTGDGSLKGSVGGVENGAAKGEGVTAVQNGGQTGMGSYIVLL